MTDQLTGEILILAVKSIGVFVIAVVVIRAIWNRTPDFPNDDGERM